MEFELSYFFVEVENLTETSLCELSRQLEFAPEHSIRIFATTLIRRLRTFPDNTLDINGLRSVRGIPKLNGNDVRTQILVRRIKDENLKCISLYLRKR